jgi:C4-dicarboxylate transporter DctM subunit
MTGIELASWSFPVLLALIFIRVPIGLAMAVCGLVGAYFIYGSHAPILNQLKQVTYSTFSNYNLSVIPLFLLMGQFAALGGMSQALFKAAEAWVGHRKGGVAMAAIGACAGFGAICGSSLATAATMGQVALPELKRAGYSGALSTATLAAGGTLGILIPPSVVLVIYAILTEQNIAKLFPGGVHPGHSGGGGLHHRDLAVRSPQAGQRWQHAPHAHGRTLEGHVQGVAGAGHLPGGGRRHLHRPLHPHRRRGRRRVRHGCGGLGCGGLKRASCARPSTARPLATGMIFMIVLGAGLYNTFLALSQLPQELAQWVIGLGMSPWLVLTTMLVVYLLLGCVMDSLSMILLTIPIFFPMIMGLDFGMNPEETAIWFGILVLIVVEVGLITPPVGMNLFVINSMAKDTPIVQTYRGVTPFVISDLVRTAILAAFPAITLIALRMTS